MTGSLVSTEAVEKHGIFLRRFPYPYRAGLAICSDIDQTANAQEFVEIHRFLNTFVDGRLGKGLGLEIGDSFFAASRYRPDRQLSFSSSSLARRLIVESIRCGIIDCLHSYSDGKYCRSEITAFLALLERSGCEVKVWVDHDASPYNLGKHGTCGRGDVRDSEFYHADLTLQHGVRFAWMGEVTSVVGQENPLGFRKVLRILSRRRPFGHFAFLKQLGKIFLGFVGVERYHLYRTNDLIRIRTLQDGQKVYEFVRCNPHWQGVGHGANPRGFVHVLSREKLKELVDSEGYMILYTHFGEKEVADGSLPLRGWETLNGVAGLVRKGILWVTTTLRLLEYHVRRRYLDWSWSVRQDNQIAIRLNGVKDPIAGTYVPTDDEVQGLTFYVPSDLEAEIWLGDRPMKAVRNPSDHSGRASVSIPLRRAVSPYELERQFENLLKNHG